VHVGMRGAAFFVVGDVKIERVGHGYFLVHGDQEFNVGRHSLYCECCGCCSGRGWAAALELGESGAVSQAHPG
jgi:hypothetical protein